MSGAAPSGRLRSLTQYQQCLCDPTADEEDVGLMPLTKMGAACDGRLSRPPTTNILV